EGENGYDEKNHEDDFGLEDELIRPKVVKDIFQEDDDNDDSQAREDTFIRKRPKRRKVIRRLRDNDPETETAGFERDVHKELVKLKRRKVAEFLGSTS
ncbi:hypothetical protein CWB94_23810, partial [Pseudoalteromonas piscicida]